MLDGQGFQCAFCMTGFIMATTGFLKTNPNPTRAELARHLRQSVPVRGLQQDPRLHDERRRAREEGVMADEHHSRPHPAHPHLAHLHPARPAHLAHLPHPVPRSFPPIDPNGFKLIGKNYTTQDLLAKVTGRARYAEDFRADGMLFAKLMLSPRPHARIVSIDASRALAMPGVHAVLTADDLPPPAPPAGPPPAAGAPPSAAAAGGVRALARRLPASKRPRVQLRRPAPVRPPHPGRHRPPRPCLQRNRLRQHRRRFRPSSRWQRRRTRANQSWPLPPTARNWPRPRSNRFRSSSRRSTSPSIRSIACVRAARTAGRKATCLSAARSRRLSGPRSSTRAPWPAPHRCGSRGHDRLGRCREGLRRGDVIVEHTSYQQSTSHQPLESRTAMAYWQNGKLYLHGSTQSVSRTVASVAGWVGVPPRDIVIISEYTGGGFGSKIPGAQTMAIPALLSKKLNGRPVMMRISREEETYIGRTRPGFQAWAKMGFKKDGRVTAVDAFIIEDAGPYRAQGDNAQAANLATLLYQAPNARFRGLSVATNTPPRISQRAPGLQAPSSSNRSSTRRRSSSASIKSRSGRSTRRSTARRSA